MDEDIENRQVEYAEKLEAINKKLEYSRKKAEDERIKLKEEFDANVVVCSLNVECLMSNM